MKMKKFFMMMMVVAATIFMASCSSGDEILEKNEKGVISLKAIAGKTTKGTTTVDAIPEELKIRVFATTDGTNYTPYIGTYSGATDNVFYIKTSDGGGTWKTYQSANGIAEFILREPDASIQKLVFVGVYDKNDSIEIKYPTKLNNYPIILDMTVDHVNRDDMIVGTAEWTTGTNNINIIYNHIFSQLNFTVENLDDNDVTIKAISISNVVEQGTYTISSDAASTTSLWSNNSTKKDNTLFPIFDGSQLFAKTTTGAVKFPATSGTVNGLPTMFVPTDNMSGMKLAVYYTDAFGYDHDKQVTLNAIAGVNVKLEAGKAYNINIKFNKGMTLSATLTGWIDEASTDVNMQ